MSEPLSTPPLPPSSSSSPQLDYAPRPPVHRRRNFRRIVIVVIVAALFLPAAWATRRGYERARLLYWQRRCASFSMPAGAVAYDENPATAAVLWASVASSGNYTKIVDRSGSIVSVIMRPRGQWETSIRQPRGGFNQMGAVFLHARRAPGRAADRIVCVHPYAPLTYRGSLPAEFGASSPDFAVEVHDYATVLNDSTPLYQNNVNVAGLAAEPFGTVRILAGQIDPADESHFSIGFQTASGSGTIDGRLRADDSVTLTLRQAASRAASTTPASPGPVR